MSSFTNSSGEENMSEPCKVCEKPGKGFHYGAWTCESCKCFFWRFADREIGSFVCDSGSGKCDLSEKKIRVLCQYCRLLKCVKLGMTRIKGRRIRLGGQAQRAYTPNNIVSQSPSASPDLQSLETKGFDDTSPTESFDSPKLTEQEEIHNIVEIYKEGCCFTGDKMQNFEIKEYFKVVNSQNVEIVKAWTGYAKEYETDIRALLPFIDELQDSFNSHDKAILLKRSAFQFYLLRRVRALKSYGLHLSDGRFVETTDLYRLYGTPLVNGMFQFVDRIIRLACSDEDIAMYISLVFFYLTKNDDLALLKLQNPERFFPAQQKFGKLFLKHVEDEGDDETVVQELVDLWPKLEELKVMHQERLEILKPYRWLFPQDSLFAEVYDLGS